MTHNILITTNKYTKLRSFFLATNIYIVHCPFFPKKKFIAIFA